jgi:hypothetical protein
VDSILVRESPSSGYHLVQRGHSIQRIPKDWQALVNNLDSGRTGDLILILKAGHYFGNKGYGSEHGSISAGDLGVPLILAQGGVVPLWPADTVSTTQIAATIPSYLGITVEGLSPMLPGVRYRGVITRVD